MDSTKGAVALLGSTVAPAIGVVAHRWPGRPHPKPITHPQLATERQQVSALRPPEYCDLAPAQVGEVVYDGI